ncbi:MAG: RNA polymerase sigma factor [Bryobacteraceae bacterium]|nr:RNA polymerase sigma factor [Bryobacteraceae bacterium]
MTQAESRLEAALLKLYDLHAAGLLRFARACTHEPGAAEEAVQQVFLDLLAEWRRGVQVARTGEWLYRGIRHYFVVTGQHAEEQEQAESAWQRERADAPAPDLEAPVRQREVRRKLLRISSPREYEILLLRTEGFSYGEIACILEIHPGTVASTLSRALRKVKQEFRRDFG